MRTPCDSVAVILDEDGYRTVDNTISLTINRDGAPMFSRTYARRAFKIGISDADFSQYVLMNMVFDRMTTSGPRFIATLGVGSADDVFVQFALTVGSDGTTNIEQTEMFEEEEIDRFPEEEKK
mgnify:CR=1 FL=1